MERPGRVIEIPRGMVLIKTKSICPFATLDIVWCNGHNEAESTTRERRNARVSLIKARDLGGPPALYGLPLGIGCISSAQHVPHRGISRMLSDHTMQVHGIVDGTVLFLSKDIAALKVV